VVWIDRAGQQQPIPLEPARYSAPRISPDGGRLVMAVAQGGSGSDIEVYDFRRQTTARLTYTHNNARPVWAPDGKHIAFVTESAHSLAIRWVRADGAGEVRTLLEDRNEMDPWSFSPEGRLAFAWIATDGVYHLWTLPLDLRDPDNPKPGPPQPFLRTRFNQMCPAFSPDGRWIAYLGGETPGMSVSPFPPVADGDSPKWQISTGGQSPIWSRSRNELFYEENGRIMAVDYSAGRDSFALGKPRVWSTKPLPATVDACCDSWYLDAAQDGQRFVIFPAPQKRTSSVDAKVILNFFDELRRRVPVR
jgi:Tol biopolymer transport system component